jgi:hypothetical protein
VQVGQYVEGRHLHWGEPCLWQSVGFL